MANQIIGRIDRIGETVQIPSKTGGEPFLKREVTLCVQRFDSITGEQIGSDNFPTVEFTGGKCAELDTYKVGQVVIISFDVQGRKWQNADGEMKYFTSIRGYRIESRERGKQADPQQAVLNAVPDTAPQQPVINAELYTAPQQTYDNDLPF